MENSRIHKRTHHFARRCAEIPLFIHNPPLAILVTSNEKWLCLLKIEVVSDRQFKVPRSPMSYASDVSGEAGFKSESVRVQLQIKHELVLPNLDAQSRLRESAPRQRLDLYCVLVLRPGKPRHRRGGPFLRTPQLTLWATTESRRSPPLRPPRPRAARRSPGRCGRDSHRCRRRL